MTNVDPHGRHCVSSLPPEGAASSLGAARRELITYRERVQAALREFGIPGELIARRNLVLCEEPAELVLAQLGENGRQYLTTPATKAAWDAMLAAATLDGIPLAIVSAYRSLERQCEIVRDKLVQGLTIDQVLSASAPPGYSEHHTGRAIDIGTSEAASLEEIFETTGSYQWLSRHAGAFGFSLSFPRDNRYGYIHEPWHWCYQGG